MLKESEESRAREKRKKSYKLKAIVKEEILEYSGLSTCKHEWELYCWSDVPISIPGGYYVDTWEKCKNCGGRIHKRRFVFYES